MLPIRKFRRNLIGATFLFLLAVLPALSQTSEEYKKKYKQLDETHYLVRLDVVFSAEFVEGQICKIVIEPMSLFEASKRANGIEQLPGKLMHEKVVEEVIDELVPAAQRGQPVHTGSYESGCNEQTLAEYEHFMISRKFHRCQKESGEVVTVSIKTKEAKCGWNGR
jgi:hypothetical protein